VSQVLVAAGGPPAVAAWLFSYLYRKVASRLLSGDPAAVQQAEQRGLVLDEWKSVLAGSAVSLIHVWVSHFGLWNVADWILEWPAKLLVLLVAAAAYAGFWITSFAFWADVWGFFRFVSSTTRLPCYLARLAALQLSTRLNFVTGSLAAVRELLQWSSMLAAPALTAASFLAWPVAAPLSFLASCVAKLAKACFLLPWFPWIYGILRVLVMRATLYLWVYVLPLSIVTDMTKLVCSNNQQRLPDVDATAAETESWRAPICDFQVAAVASKVSLRKAPWHSWWIDLLLLGWAWAITRHMVWCAADSSQGSKRGAAATGKQQQGDPGRQERLAAARQRKEAKAAQRKQQKQQQRGH
jgi:hypothetical protein